MNTVHIRAPSGQAALCGERGGESVSRSHYVEHVVPFKNECCKGIAERMCGACLRVLRRWSRERV